MAEAGQAAWRKSLLVELAVAHRVEEGRSKMRITDMVSPFLSISSGILIGIFLNLTLGVLFIGMGIGMVWMLIFPK